MAQFPHQSSDDQLRHGTTKYNDLRLHPLHAVEHRLLYLTTTAFKPALQQGMLSGNQLQ